MTGTVNADTKGDGETAESANADGKEGVTETVNAEKRDGGPVRDVATETADADRIDDRDVTGTEGAGRKSGCDILSLQQNFFTDALKETNRLWWRYFAEAVIRRTLAYGLKAISIFGAILVAAKIESIDQRILGIVIAAAVGIDQLTSNHARLLSIVAAQHACDRLLATVKNEHIAKLPDILKIRDAGNSAEARRQLDALLVKLTGQVRATKETIVEGVRTADLKALNNLFVDVKGQ